MNALATHLQRYFTTIAHDQRDLSPHTITAYRDTWRVLLLFLAKHSGTTVQHLDFDELTSENISAFLDYLEHERGNSVSTRNARLAAIRAILTPALPTHLTHGATLRQVLAIPPKRAPKPVLTFLNEEETATLVNAPNQQQWTGRRDHAFLVLAIQTGLRISELINLNLNDVYLTGAAHVTCLGKGRRTRSTPLTPETKKVMRAYLTERKTKPGNALFCGPAGKHLSRDALERRLKQHLATATKNCSSLANKKITLHTLRHTAAMNLLANGVDISVIALWLGHQQTQTTDTYLHADMTIKQEALDRTRPLNTKPGKYVPEPDILKWLNTL